MFGPRTSVIDTITLQPAGASGVVEVEHAMDLGVGGDLGVNSGWTEKIEGQNGLVNEEVPTVLGKARIGATADGNKVRLEGLN